MADRGRASKYPTGSEDWTGVEKPSSKLGLYRRQAQRHGMQTDDWSREQEGDSHPPFKKVTHAMQSSGGKNARGFGWSNLQPRGKR